MLTELQNKNLHIMKEDLINSDLFFKPSAVLWESLSNRFEETFQRIGINEIQSAEFNNFFSLLDNNAFRTHYFKCAMWMLYNDIKKRDKYFLLEKTSPLIPEGMSHDLVYNPANVYGRPDHYLNKDLTWDYLISLDTILNIAEVYPKIITDPCVVADLGAGWGRIGYVLSQINPKISYNIFDIPHTLLIAQEYLRDKIGSVKVYDYLINREIQSFSNNSLIDEPGIRFNLSKDLLKFEDKSIDVFINVACFQEMSYDQVDSYFGIINNKAEYFYTQQRYHDLDMEHKKYPYRANWKKMFDRDITFLPLWFEAMFKL